MKIALTLSVLAAAGALFAAENTAEPDAQSRIKILQKDLIATLQEAADVSTRLYQNARVPVADVIHAHQSLLDATLDASETKQERISALEGFIELQKKLEALTATRKSEARGTQLDVLMAKAARMKAEIALEKEKSNAAK